MRSADVSDNVVGAIDDSLRERPYTTLAIVAGAWLPFGRDVAALRAATLGRCVAERFTRMPCLKSLMREITLSVQTRRASTLLSCSGQA